MEPSIPAVKVKRPRASLRTLVNAKCKECIYDPVGSTGHWREQVTRCTSFKCPLYGVRPVTKASDSTVTGV